MSEDQQREALEILREIRDRQREAVELLKAQRALVEEQLQKSRASVQESIGLQRTALARQRQVTLIAVPGIIACLAAIAYLVIRYF
ncbi:MAG TPA: hypothetical protein VFB53_07875 [Burkholderiales bacterium]|nr:hypothetical protein [Burkholderiales bacterium]